MCPVSAGDTFVGLFANRRSRWIDLYPARPGGLGRKSRSRGVAGFREHSGNLGVREIWTAALAVAVSWRETGTSDDGSGGDECGAGVVPVGETGKRHWILDWMGKGLGPLRFGELSGVRVYRDPAGKCASLHNIRTAMGQVERVYWAFVGDPVVYGVAGGIFISGVVAELPIESLEKRDSGMVDGIDAVWRFAYYEPRVPKLALRDSGVTCGVILWMDMEKNGIDFCIRARARCGRHGLALPFPHAVRFS